MKPIHDNLKAVRIEDEETGDLIPVLDYAEIAKATKRVIINGIAGL